MTGHTRMQPTRQRLPTMPDMLAAKDRIRGVASKTPLVESPVLSRRLDCRIYLKLECFQPIRVFKIRGAYNKISQVPEREVVAVSSGNHGMAVAYSSRLLGKHSIIIVPETIVPEKLSVIEEFGGRAVRFGKSHKEREEKVREIVSETGAVFVHPFNDPDVIAGNGTCGLEIVEQLPDVDSVIVPVGGGGLISGIALAAKSTRPPVRVFGVEPVGAGKMTAALEAGKPVDISAPRSLADGLIPSSVGDLTLEACKLYVDQVLTASEENILLATKLLIHDAHIFPEPSGAASLAALLGGQRLRGLGKKVVLVISGGNISLDLLKRTLL